MKLLAIQFVSALLSILVLGYIATPWWIVAIVSSFIIVAIGWILQNKPEIQEETKIDDKNFKLVGNSISKASSRIAIGGASVSHFLDKLAGSFKIQVDNAQEIAERIKRLEDDNDELLQFADIAENRIQDSDGKTQKSKLLLAQLLTQHKTLAAQITHSKEMLSMLRSSAESIGNITTTINQLADQTNMLALNAAIEAARAGDQGRGFAVVADEVRDLAKRTTDATKGIDNVLSDINKCSQDSVASIEQVADAGEVMSTIINQTSELIQDTSVSSSEAANAMSKVKNTVSSHGETNRGISSNVLQLHETTKRLEHDLKDVSDQVLSLSNQTEDIFRQLDFFNVEEDRNFQVQKIARETASKIGSLFESAIQNGKISQQVLFEFNYKPVKNTNPQKFTTGFDQFTDSHLPSIQEPILNQYSFIIYAGAVDINGYFPTHNKKFSHPMTGNYEKDLANSRTKRVFDDYTGARCGKNTQKFLLQTYKRDTGEIMHDLSAPIYVNGKHWGGFRIGYSASEH
ncbi:methyl-accepting chemotaxis protein [Aliiglaciecola sp. LCG003]|uniref:methyl-accepting chemotaxis protein n=1 Tax=Aliiglaciecola sp. LCG003 TaxID=3053655 RepID=UPI002572AA64|nr:methyl-accepting chemotaxis protein [Aliiglaciecola sp. LCG003]WJG08015.1 methyl-accepting chemotaxis protein [Aliiglaciecola sp. LCG003]